MINLIHEIDSLQAMLGSISAVSAHEGRRRRGRAVEETTAVALSFESGVVGTVTLSDSSASPWSWERATGENISMFPKNAESPYRFLFERGALEFPQLKVSSQDPPDWTEPFVIQAPVETAPYLDVFAEQLAHFADVVERRTAPRVTVRDGVLALNVAATVRRLMAEGGGFASIHPIEWDDNE
jgi:predicted dehydrogenase